MILTNPDMLHVGILPHHDRWGDVLHNLRYVVVDEAHVYRGVFGSHVGNVLRRLRRLARAYGAEPRSCSRPPRSRTPAELARALTGEHGDRHRRRHVGQGAARRRPLEPGPARPGARAAREQPLGGLAAHGRPRLARPPDDLLREEPQGRRADPPLHLRAGRPRDGGSARAVPGRLHACAAARDRATARGRGAARRLGDRRARARDRHRRAGLRDLGRLPRNGRVAPPAMGAGRTARARPRGARRERGRARPVLHARARGAARAQRRGDAARSREPADPRPACLCRRLRGPRIGRATLRRSARRRSSRAPLLPELESHAGRIRLEGTRHARGQVLAPLRRPRLVHDRRRHERRRARPRRAGAGVLRGARGRRLPPPRRAVPRARLDGERRTAVVEPARVDWYTQVKKDTQTAIDADAAHGACRGRRAPLRAGLGDRAGDRLPAKGDSRRVDARGRAADPARGDASRPRRSGSRPTRPSSTASRRCRSCSARSMRPSTR